MKMGPVRVTEELVRTCLWRKYLILCKILKETNISLNLFYAQKEK